METHLDKKCLLWGDTWSRKLILFHCVNQATVDIKKDAQK